MNQPSSLQTRNSLRRELRQRRQNAQQTLPDADQDALRLWQHDRRLRSAQRVAIYVAYASEFPTAGLAEHLRHRGCAVYHPVIRQQRLQFFSTHCGHCLRPNRFGILEPPRVAHRRISLNRCDVVVLPLLGYDDLGTRLGTGGGYYDRSLAFRKARRRWQRPLLLGLAYSAQHCEPLSRASWDVPLDGILTERGLTWFR